MGFLLAALPGVHKDYNDTIYTMFEEWNILIKRLGTKVKLRTRFRD